MMVAISSWFLDSTTCDANSQNSSPVATEGSSVACRDGGLLAREQAVDQGFEHGPAELPFLARAERAVVGADARQIGKFGDQATAEPVDRTDVCVREQKELLGEAAVGGVLFDRLGQRRGQLVFQIVRRRDGEGDDDHPRDVAGVVGVGQHPDHPFGQRGGLPRARRRRDEQGLVGGVDRCGLRRGPVVALLARHRGLLSVVF